MARPLTRAEGGRAMETWRLLHTWDRAPGFNMALDEAFLVVPGARPTLRFYTWSPDTLSLGYFQRVRDVPAVERASAVVRRLTGGGAIHHAEELTFSISAPLEHPLYRGNVRASYERVHRLIRTALLSFGVQATPRGERKLASDRERGGMCFERSTDIDLAWGDAKGVGSAQRRSATRVLHHGSIKLGRTSLDANVAAIRDFAPAADAREVAREVARVFGAELHVNLRESEPNEAELEHTAKRAAYFTSDEFVRRR